VVRRLIFLATFAALSTASSAAVELPSNALRVPLVRQATSYSCGVATLLSVLYYWNAYDGKESSLYDQLNTTPDDGTHPARIVAVAKSFGLKAGLVENMTIDDLRMALDRGETVIVNLQAWRAATSTRAWSQEWEEGHYAVLVALDGRNAYFMDPSTPAAYTFVPLDELPQRWHDYENRYGIRWETNRLGIVIKGTNKPRSRYPDAPVRML
jgi:predicted double-glycine peptidase